ncbi:MAG: TonB-dependent receptor [Chitinophagales bacterium]|nr:TonB-dependent receptor [Chitinophagales bacterium]
MRKFLCAIATLISIAAFSQTAIKGTVVDDKDNAPLYGVNVVKKGTTEGVVTDLDGRFELNVKPGKILLEFSYMGYDKRVLELFVKEGETKTVSTRLAETQKELDIVVVTGSKYEKKLGEETVSMEVLKGQQITQSSARAEEALNYVPGVNMLGKNTSIRGGGGFADGAGSRVLVMLDDIPITSPENGGVNWNGMPLEAIEQVEIIKGASSASYGSSALNGIMNFRTIAPKTEMYNKILVNIGFYGEPKDKSLSWFWRKTKTKKGKTKSYLDLPMFGGFQYTHAKKYGNFDVVLSGAYQEDESFRYANRQRTIRGFAKLRYIPKKFDRITVGLNAGVLRENYQDFFVMWGYDNDTVNPWPDYAVTHFNKPAPFTTYASTDTSFGYLPSQISNRSTTTVNVDPYITYYDKKENRHSLKSRVYYTELFNDANSGSFRIVNGDSIYGGDSSKTLQGYLEYGFLKEFKPLALVISTGASFYYTTVHSNTFDSRTAYNLGAFVNIDKKFFNKLTLNVGLRLEHAKLDTQFQKADLFATSINSGKNNLVKPVYSPVIPVIRIGLNYQATEGTFLRLSFGQGFRFPSIAEKFVRTVRSGTAVFPNPELLPEAGWGAELGIKQGMKISRWVFYADASAFVNYFKNMIEFQGADPSKFPGAGLAFQATNVPAARIVGAEISTIGSGKIYSVPLNFIVGYTFINPINLAYNADSFGLDYKILKYRIEHSFKADVSANIKGVNVGVRCFYNSFIKEIDKIGVGALPSINNFRAKHDKGDFVMDVRVGYSYKDKLSFNVIAKNVTNAEYTLRPGLIEAPRNYTFQVGYQF